MFGKQQRSHSAAEFDNKSIANVAHSNNRTPKIVQSFEYFVSFVLFSCGFISLRCIFSQVDCGFTDLHRIRNANSEFACANVCFLFWFLVGLHSSLFVVVVVWKFHIVKRYSIPGTGTCIYIECVGGICTNCVSVFAVLS